MTMIFQGERKILIKSLKYQSNQDLGVDYARGGGGISTTHDRCTKWEPFG